MILLKSSPGKAKGLDDDSGLKMALDDAVKFAATYRKGKEIPRDLSDIKQEKRIKKLKNDLKLSKQQVVRHLIQCRAIETTMKQSILTNEAIKNHISINPIKMESKNQNSTRSNLVRSFNNNGGLSSAYLVERDLQAIERIPSLIDSQNLRPLPYQSAFSLQRSLITYDDDFLTHELEQFPACQVDAINIMLFSKIAWIASGKHISITEAIDIYQRGDEMTDVQLEHLHLRGRITSSSSDHSSGDRNTIRWIILKNMLRKKLRLQYLAVQLSKFEESMKLKERPKSSKSIDNSNTRDVSKSCKLLSKSLDFNSQFSLPNVNVLSNQLEKSHDRQSMLNRKINSNISMVARSVPLGSLQSATNYSKRVGGKKMYTILFIKAKGFWKLAFDKLRNNMKMYKNELICQHFLKSYSAHRFYYASCNAIQNKTKRRLDAWKTKLNNLRTLEQFAAIIEIQRCMRGKCCRIYVKNIHKHRAVTKIQKYMRSYIAKILVHRLLELNRLRRAVLFIENCWKKQTWQRALKNLFKLRKQTLASDLIIRVYYGHLGRKVARTKRLMIAKQIGALKMQCLWRRYQAMILVDVYYSQRKRFEAAIVIQKVTRGIQGRRFVVEFRRRKNSAECIQRAARCRQARKNRMGRHVNKSSTILQRVMRGKLARDRVNQMRRRRAQELATHAHAFGIVEKIILGHARRKKYVPKIAANTKKRLTAVGIIKERFKAVKVGNRERAVLAKKRKSVAIIVRTIQEYMYYKYLRIECATLIQSVMRRHLAKRIIREKQAAHVLFISKQKLYYRLKNMFQKDQNAFFGSQATVIQKCWRSYHEVKVRKEMKELLERMRAVEEIQRVGMNYVRRRAAKEIVNAKRKIVYKKEYAVVKIQKISRGKAARVEYNKHRQANIMKWFLLEAKSIMITKGLFLNFKQRKETLKKMNFSAVKIQALARGVSGRGKVRKNYKRLVRSRDKTITRKRERAAMKIQSIVRRRQAMKIVRIRQVEFAEKERKRKQLEELDAKLDDLHNSHLNDLLALRVQQGVRGSQARKHRQQQEEKIVNDRVKKDTDRRLKAVAIIQGLARGIRGRRKFKEMLPDLQKQFRARAFCVECELAPATRKCRVCREQFCDVCFQNLHRKGTRKGHGFDYIRKSDHAVDGTVDLLGEKNPMMWEEQWDDSAQARYWYHSITGEATWINPFE